MAIKGTNNNTDIALAANSEGELIVRAISESVMTHATDDGDAWVFQGVDANIDSGDTILFIKYTGNGHFHFDRAELLPGNIICQYNFGIGTATTTPAGGVVVPRNLNGDFLTKQIDIDARTDETAVADADLIATYQVGTIQTITINLSGYRINKNQYLQINQETESTAGNVVVFGYESA